MLIWSAFDYWLTSVADGRFHYTGPPLPVDALDDISDLALTSVPRSFVGNDNGVRQKEYQ